MANARPPLEKNVPGNVFPSLPSKRRKIRIFTLFPGSPPSPLECQFRVCDLDERPRFETISYTWGEKDDMVPFAIDGVEFTIPRNLYIALQYIRSQDDALTLWADAICIDQGNDEEKAEQVAMMGDIFRECSSMYLWLGEPKQSPERNPWGLVEHYAANKHYHQLPEFQFLEEEEEWTFQDSPHFQDMWASLTDMLSKAWWARLWCVQESVLSPTATVMLGQWKIPWSKILIARSNQAYHEIKCCAFLGGLMPPKYFYLPDNLVAHAVEKSSELDSSQDTEGMGLDRVLRTFRYKACKDPRDRVYSLLGLVKKSMATRIRPDYSLPLDDVYIQAMMASIAEGNGDLQCLTGSGFNSDRHNLPTWVRDLSAPLTRIQASCEMTRYHFYHLYNAAYGARRTTESSNATTLALTGISVDSIGSIGKILHHGHSTRRAETLRKWANIARVNDTESGSSRHEIYESFWRTVTADVVVREGEPTKRTRDSTEESKDQEIEAITQYFSDQIEVFVGTMWRTTMYAANNRAFFRTHAGHFGLCPPDARPGDQIWVLSGGRVPFVLRAESESARSENGSGPEMPTFKFVGECYLDGFMDGEAFRTGERSLREVHLI